MHFIKQKPRRTIVRVDSIVCCVYSIVYCDDNIREWYPYQPAMRISGFYYQTVTVTTGYVIISLMLNKIKLCMHKMFSENFSITNPF